MKRMLFNATHAEELRVAIVDGQRLVDLDIETAGREQRKSNIYKGVVTRVEPSLEACFVNYGEERHGFLPFKEIAREYFKPGVDAGRASIKEAIAEGTEMLVQVEKEERGNKGAALTTYISLAGRYLVLMPNNPRGGGVSRRIEGEDRQELKETMDQLALPAGMSMIARTAGIGRTADELQWDLNYLLQLWKAVDDARSLQAGAYLIYQESSLVIRAIRDYFHPDIGEILIDTDDVYEQARQFMLHVMPDMAPRVKRYRDDVPLFSRFQIEHQIETAYSRQVQLPSGGALVIDHTEALVAVDVNSAKATRGSDIEETALRTNLEAADEVGRQLRLRDLGGLIVIDFIDMESTRAQREVEQRLRDALHHDRARVQMGKISRFGLMELSRQRLRPALNEGSHITCPRCNGTGVIRDIDSSALHILRILQEEAMKENTAAVHVQVPVEVASFLLNEKRTDIAKLEARLKVTIILIPNKHLETPNYKIERLRHDDPRLEDVKASYALVDDVVTDAFDLKAREEATQVKARQEAVVKGITPSSPAPVSVNREREAAREAQDTEGFLAKVFKFFSSLKASSPAEPEPTPAGRGRQGQSRNGERSERGDRGGRGGEGRQGQGRNGRGRGQAEGRGDGRDRDAREGREPREPREGRESREAREGDQEGRQKRGRGRGQGEGREGREPREAREPRETKDAGQTGTAAISGEGAAAQGGSNGQNGSERQGGGRGRGRQPRESVDETTDQTLMPADAQAEGAADQDQGEGGRRRRRRRGGRGRGGEAGEATELEGTADLLEGLSSEPIVVPQAGAESITVAEPVSAPIAPPSATTTSPVGVSELATQAPLAIEPAAAEPAAIVAPAAVAPIEVVPAAVPATPAAPAAPALDPEALRQELEGKGLQWVETKASAPIEAAAEPTPQLGRKPRRQTVETQSEPLMMVETRSSEQSSGS